MKNRSINIMIVAFLLFCVMSTILIAFIINAHDTFDEKIKVRADGVTESVMTVRDLHLSPTESKEYTVDMVCEASGSYHIYLDYVELTDGGMKPFVRVTVSYGDTVAYEGTLAELIDTDAVVCFETELTADDPVPITVRYEMPREVGNEAQGTYAGFDVNIKIEKS